MQDSKGDTFNLVVEKVRSHFEKIEESHLMIHTVIDMIHCTIFSLFLNLDIKTTRSNLTSKFHTHSKIIETQIEEN